MSAELITALRELASPAGWPQVIAPVRPTLKPRYYVIPDGLSTLHIDRDADLGTYTEPNVWMQHR